MQRRTKKVARALSLKARRKPSLTEAIPLPKPIFEFEDTLVTQLRASDVLSNCYEDYDGEITIGLSNESPRKHVVLRHPCHHDNNLVPVWQAFYNLDKRGTGAVLLGRLMSLSSLIGPIISERFISEKSVHEHFIDTTHVTFTQYRHFIEKCLNRNPLAFSIDWQRLRTVCWSQCERWHLQAIPFDIPEGYVPPELNYALFWLWCIFNQIAEPEVYPPSADYEEVELLLRKLFSSIGILWEEYDDNVSSMSGASSANINSHHENGVNRHNSYDGGNIRISTIRKNSYVRMIEEEAMDTDESTQSGTETLLVTFQQFLSIIGDMLGSETVQSAGFGKAVKQIYLTEVDEIIKTGWLSLKKPGTDVWKRRWAVLRKAHLEFYSGNACEVVKYQITLNNKMHVESLPDTSSHKHRFRLVEREGDFNIAWEAEMSCNDAQHSHSWMLIMNLTMKVQQIGLTTKRIELAERRLERHRRRESELSAIEKRREVHRTRKKLEEIRERWNLMQAKLTERAAVRDGAMENMKKMDEIYDKLQALAKKQSLVRKTNLRIRSAFPSVSAENGSDLSAEERILIESRDQKLNEHNKKMQRLEDEKRKLEEELLGLQAATVLLKDSEKTLIFVYGPERQASFLQEQQRNKALENAASEGHSSPAWKKKHSLIQNNNIPAISISTNELSSKYSEKTKTLLSKSHPELRGGSILIDVGSSPGHVNGKLKMKSSLDSDLSSISGERLV